MKKIITEINERKEVKKYNKDVLIQIYLAG